jgi:hypothetical protein
MLAGWADTRAGTADTGKVDVLVARVPGDLPRASALPTAAPAPPPVPSRADRRLLGACTHGPPVDSRRSPVAVVRSFVSALDADDLFRAYGYLDPRWRSGHAPVRIPHPFVSFAGEYHTLTCARLAGAELYDRSEDGRWATFRIWFAARRGGGPTRLGIGIVWTHSDTARAPWSVMGFWTRELATR